MSHSFYYNLKQISGMRVCPITPDTAVLQPIYHQVGPGRDCLEIENLNQVWLGRTGAWLINWSNIPQVRVLTELRHSEYIGHQHCLNVTFGYIWSQWQDNSGHWGRERWSHHTQPPLTQPTFIQTFSLSPSRGSDSKSRRALLPGINQAQLICKFGNQLEDIQAFFMLKLLQWWVADTWSHMYVVETITGDIGLDIAADWFLESDDK